MCRREPGYERRRRRGGRDRAFIGAGEDGDAAVGLDAHRHFGADQIEALRAHLAVQQRHAGNSDFGLGRARHDGPVGVAHHDIAQPQRGAALFVALDLGAADSDGMFAAEIFLDRLFQPRRRHVELDRPLREPPPQPEHRDNGQCQSQRRTPEHAADPGTADKADHATLQVAPSAPAVILKVVEMISLLRDMRRQLMQLRMRGQLGLRMMRVLRMTAVLPGRMTRVRLRGARLLALMLFAHHSSAGTPRSAHGDRLPPGNLSTAQGRLSRNPLRPPDANGSADNDRPKATKGRHMAHPPEAGDKAPAFTLPRDGSAKVSLKDFKGRNLVLYFYPKADTAGCTQEAIAFSRLRGDFAKAGTEILGVSADPVPALDKFKTKHKLAIALASDETKAMLEAFGAWGEKSMYGRKYYGVHRKTFLIDGKGRIARVWPKVRVAGHAEEVLAAARAL